MFFKFDQIADKSLDRDSTVFKVVLKEDSMGITKFKEIIVRKVGTRYLNIFSGDLVLKIDLDQKYKNHSALTLKSLLHDFRKMITLNTHHITDLRDFGLVFSIRDLSDNTSSYTMYKVKHYDITISGNEIIFLIDKKNIFTIGEENVNRFQFY